MGTFAVVRSPEKVVLQYLDVPGGGQAQVNGMRFTGGAAVYEGDLQVEHCRFSAMQSAAAIHLKNGQILMRQCLVTGNASEALAVDFGTGEVRDNHFVNCRVADIRFLSPETGDIG